jgi:hypothetical protein
MNNDSTERLPNEQDEYDTKPGITAVLERINALDEKWENRFAAFETKQEARHQEVLGQLRKLNQQFELVAIDITKARQSCEITVGGLNN